MQPKTTQKIERYLDEQLGMWTRLLPWRREMAVHLEEAHDASQAAASETTRSDSAWQRALTDFGNVQEVAFQLRSEHWPQYIGWRLIAIVFGLSIVFSVSHPWALIDLPALGFALCPMVLFVFFDTFRGSTRWAFANRIGTWGCVCGAVIGVVYILTDLNDPSNIGTGMALSILSAMYGVIFFTPRRIIVLLLVGISLVDVGFMFFNMHPTFAAGGSSVSLEGYSPQHWSIDKAFVIRILAVLGAGLSMGIARFGFHGVARHAYSVGAGIFLLSIVVMLGELSDPTTLIGHLLVALGAMGLAIACIHCASDSSGLLQRIRR